MAWRTESAQKVEEELTWINTCEADDSDGVQQSRLGRQYSRGSTSIFRQMEPPTIRFVLGSTTTLSFKTDSFQGESPPVAAQGSDGKVGIWGGGISTLGGEGGGGGEGGEGVGGGGIGGVGFGGGGDGREGGGGGGEGGGGEGGGKGTGMLVVRQQVPSLL